MNDEKKKPPPDPDSDSELDFDDLGVVVDDLPPLDDDQVDEADPATLADYLAEFEEGEPVEDEDPAAEEAAAMETAEELTELEGSWIDDGAESPNEELDIGVEEEDVGWSEDDESGEPLGLEDDWFVDESVPTESDDGGEEGPLDDELTEIDSSTWDDLGDDLDDDDDSEPVEDVMDRLGISFPEEEGVDRARRERVRIDRGVVLERQFLGPVGSRIDVVAVDGGAVVGAGEGIFVLGADGMLHQISAAVPGHCSSLCVFGSHTFIGTRGAGAFRLGERRDGAVPINGWNTIWVGNRPVTDRVTTSFDLVGQQLGDEIRLVGWTGEGQLFASVDLGQSWTGPLTEGKCLGAAVVEGSGEVFALVRGAGGPSRLVASDDLETWRDLRTPPSLAGAEQPGEVCIAATGSTLVAAVGEPGAPLVCSLDGGQGFSERPELTGVTALAVDPSGPGWIAAATYDEERDLGLVRVSEDGGQSWKTAAVAGQEPQPRGRAASDEPAGRVSCLVLDVGRTRRLYVVAGEGAQRIVLSRGGLTQ